MIRIEEERSEGLNLEFAERIGTFADGPLDIETEGNEVKASLNAEDGRLQASFRLDSFKLSFSNKVGIETYEACSPVVEVKLRHPFLRFKLQNGDSVRAIKEYETISIEHLGFDLYDLK